MKEIWKNQQKVNKDELVAVTVAKYYSVKVEDNKIYLFSFLISFLFNFLSIF